jgi:hypothetical protein
MQSGKKRWTEQIVMSRTGSVDSRQIAPGRAGPQDPEDAIKDSPVVHAGNATRFVREHRPNDVPFEVGEFVTHDSMLQFGSLNHVQDPRIKGESAFPRLEGEQTYGRHREIDTIDP